MRQVRNWLLAAAVAAPLAALAASSLTPLFLPHGHGGIGFDDLTFSPALHRVLVPSGRTGLLNLLDPQTFAIESVSGFSTQTAFGGGHGAGTTSADYGHGLVFASDRSRKVIEIVDPVRLRILASVKLGGAPDYVRWVEANSEVWVTEPARKVIEYFKLDSGGKPALVLQGTIPIADGPESLVIDATRARAYTHTWHNTTVVIDLQAHRDVAHWPNGCVGARGIALDEARGLLFVGCEEGKATVLDLNHPGRIVGSLDTSGKGVDLLAYSPSLAHLYVPGGDTGTMAILGVKPDGSLQALATVLTAADAHCVAADDAGHAYVCDPKAGKLLVFTDTLPAAK
jgi:DNA-binding beta-propeller fold protein YncE